MNKNHNEELYLEFHKPIDGYGVLAKPTRKQFKETEFNGFRLTMIPKENIGVDEEYQRVPNDKQIEIIKKSFDKDLFEFVCVYKIHDKQNGLYYYQVTDGQHRLCAHPDKVVPCRVINSKAPVTRCNEANDAKTKKDWVLANRFWNKVTEIKRVPSCKDEEMRKIFLDKFEDAGYTSVDPTKNKTTDLGGKAHVIHELWVKHSFKNIDRRKVTAPEKALMKIDVLTDTIKIMQSVLSEPLTNKNNGSNMWSSLFDWLSNDSKGLGCDYDVDEIISALSSDKWKFKTQGKPKWRTRLHSPKDFSSAAGDLIEKKKVTNRRHDAHLEVYNQMLECYRKLNS